MTALRAAGLLLLTLSTLACRDPAGSHAGRLTGQLDGTPWSGTAQIGPGAADEPVLLSGVASASVQRMIGVRLPVGPPGTYPIGEGDAWYIATPRGLPGDPYVAVSVEGTLVIRRAEADEMRGTLEVTFRGLGGETLRFTDGEFLARAAPLSPLR